MARRGVYWRLRDPATPWSDRIKLVRYAWRHQAVHIPNKHQVLLDWLTLSLTGKKRVAAAEAEGPWRCLCDVLWSRICQSGTGTRAGLVIKNTVGQVLLDELRGHLPGGRGKSGAGADTLLSCVEAVLTSRSLQHVYTNRIDTMMQLLGVVCELCVQDVEEGRAASSHKVALLTLLLTHLARTPWRRVNVQQALSAACSHLLPSAARFMHTATQLSAQNTQLCAFLCHALFHTDLWEHYQLYIGTKVTSSSATPGATLPKDVEVTFKVIETLLQAEGSRKYILSFLPTLYEGFLNAYTVGGTQSGMHLLIYLTTLLGIHLTPQGQTEVTGQTQVTGQEVSTLGSLLEVAVQHEVYDVSYGGIPEERQLPWLQQLAGCLLTTTDKCVSWYDCLHHLVAMDHTIVENRLSDVFTAAWVNVKELNIEQQAAQGRLLAQLVILYGRLRRFPVMIDRCLSALRGRSLATPLHWPLEFTHSLITVMAALPPNSCVSLWRTLLTELTSHYLTQGHLAALAGEAGVGRLLGTLLSHAHLADYTMPHQVAALVRDLLQTTSQDVVNVMLHRTLKEPQPDLESVLSLTAACGDLRLLLVQFTPLTLGGSTAGGSPSWSDMSLLYPGVAAAGWAAICKRATEMEDVRGLHHIDELAVQKLRAVLLQDEADSEGRREVLQNVATYLLDRLTGSYTDTAVVWDKQVGGIDGSNWQVALLDLVCRHGTLLVPVWSDVQTLQFIQRLVLDLVLQTDTPTRPQEHVTMLSVASDVLGGATWNELVAIQSAVVTVILDQLAQLCLPTISVKKKRRSSVEADGGSPLAAGLLTALSDTNTSWQHVSADDGEVADILQTVSDGVMVLLTSDAERFTLTHTQPALRLLQILDRLPLEHFTPLNKARCILGHLVLTSTRQSELVSASLSQLSVVLDSADVTVSMRRLDPGSLLLWLLTTADEDSKSLSLREDVVFNILKQATKDLTSTQLLKPFLAQCHVVVTQAGQGDAASTHQMALVAKTLGTLRTVVERAHQEPALRGVCVTYFTELAASTLSLLTHAMANRSKETRGVCNSALQCYRHALDHECHVMRRRQQIRQQRKAARKAEKMEVDKNKDENEEQTSDQEPEPSKSSDEASDTEDSEESEPEEGSVALRAALRSQLPSVCDTLQHTLSTAQDADSVSSCLPLVTTICTNYTHLKQHVPAGFCHAVLSLVLNTLHTEDATHTQHATSLPDNPYCHEVWSVLGKGRAEEAMETSGEGAQSGHDEGVSDGVRQTAVAIMASLSSDQFSATLHQLLSHLSVECVQRAPSKVTAALRTLQELLDAKLEDDTSLILKYACHNVLVPIQDVLSACGGTALTTATCDVISTALSTLTKMLAFGPSLLSSRCVSVCLHSCQYVPLDAVTDVSSFNTFHQRAYEVLNAMLIHHEKTVFGFIPAFIQASKRLMTSVIVQSDQSRPGVTSADTEVLVTCALRIYRLYSLIANHKVNFTKVAPYMVADYIDTVQRVTVLPKVKKSLVSAVHKVMDLCDEHAVRMLSTVLPPSGREVFRTLHTEFTRYHRYRGRV